MDERTREDRIREYAFTWYCFRLQYGRWGNDKLDWERATHAVDDEDKAKMREDERQYTLRPSRMK